jgi:predicted  nucleic acid-binding Zn-ribbon protein
MFYLLLWLGYEKNQKWSFKKEKLNVEIAKIQNAFEKQSGELEDCRKTCFGREDKINELEQRVRDSASKIKQSGVDFEIEKVILIL